MPQCYSKKTSKSMVSDTTTRALGDEPRLISKYHTRPLLIVFQYWACVPRNGGGDD